MDYAEDIKRKREMAYRVGSGLGDIIATDVERLGTVIMAWPFFSESERVQLHHRAAAILEQARGGG